MHATSEFEKLKKPRLCGPDEQSGFTEPIWISKY
jgi:hypothetical protein